MRPVSTAAALTALAVSMLLASAPLVSSAANNAALKPAADIDTVWLHTVESGDTLIGLRDRLMHPGAEWRTVQRLNRIADPRRLQVGSTLRIPLALMRLQPASAEVLHRHGEVWLERAGAQRQALQPAAVLYSGDVVVTGPQSSVSLRFQDGSRTLLGADSRLRLQRLARLGGALDADGALSTQMELEKGGVESKVQPRRQAPRFELRTPAVNLGVRGTDFRGRVQDGSTWVEVMTGMVAAGPQPVAAGFGAVATAQGVSTPVPLLGAPDLSALPAQLRRLPLQLSWPASTGAQSYRAQIYATENKTLATERTQTLVLEGVFDQPAASWVDELPDGHYTLRVRAADASGIEGLAASHDFTLDARPQPPFLLRPRAGDKVETASVTLAWSRNPEAARYRVQISQAPDFNSLVLDQADISATELSATLPLGSYYWRVASISDGRAEDRLQAVEQGVEPAVVQGTEPAVEPAEKQGPFSDALSFERIAPPPPAPGVEPTRKSDAGIVLSWGASTLAGSSYQVQVARDAAFTDIVLDQTLTGTEQLLAAPKPGTFYVRVRTIGPDGRSGGYGSVQIIDVPHGNGWLWLLPLLLLL